jgi:CRP/FNR family transcriptional regulator, cyclic AMP receptor protein
MSIGKNAKVSVFLKEVNIFEGLDNQIVNQLYRIGFVQNFRKGDLIIREGEPGGKFYVMINGKAGVVKSSKSGKSKNKGLAVLSRGSIFGEMSMFSGAPYSASIRAMTDCDIHIIRGSDFDLFLRKNPSAAYLILRALLDSISNRLRRANIALAHTSK